MGFLRSGFILFFFVVLSGNLWADTLTLTTYYPSPSGDYQDLRVMGNLGVGTASPQGALDVKSTTRAFIPPRMTTAQRDVLPTVEGSVIYNTTTASLQHRNATIWKEIGGGAGAVYVGATPGSYTGSGVGGYGGGNTKCNTAFAGSRMCAASDFPNGRPTANGWYSGFLNSGAFGDCQGWTDGTAGSNGQKWDTTVGSAPTVCNTAQKILCCQ